jgi:hypothetical protein
VACWFWASGRAWGKFFVGGADRWIVVGTGALQECSLMRRLLLTEKYSSTVACRREESSNTWEDEGSLAEGDGQSSYH